MNTATLLADPDAISLVKVISGADSMTLVVRAMRPRAECPGCHEPSRRVHSRYLRRVADLPWQGVRIVSLRQCGVTSAAKYESALRILRTRIECRSHGRARPTRFD